MHSLADGRGSRPAILCHGLVHDDDERSIGAVVGGEGAALVERDAHGFEVVAIDGSEGCELELPSFSSLAFEGIGGHAGEAGCGQTVGDAGGDDSRLGFEAAEKGAVECLR